MRSVILNKPIAKSEIKEDTESNTLHTASHSQVSIVVTEDRFSGVLQAIENLGEFSFQDEHVFLKPNFNSADPTPGSTHTDVLKALVKHIKENGASKITLGDRSGMGSTKQVMEKLNTYSLAEELEFEVLAFDDLPEATAGLLGALSAVALTGLCTPAAATDLDTVAETFKSSWDMNIPLGRHRRLMGLVAAHQRQVSRFIRTKGAEER